jgi:hypothetical protein
MSNLSLRRLEFVVLFVGSPLLILATRSRAILITLLWVGGILAYRTMPKKLPPVDDIKDELNLKHGIRWILIRFAILAPLITFCTWYFLPETFLSFPRERPRVWIIVMILYPVLSVWPQEMIYRSFIFNRYKELFGQKSGYVTASALSFGYAHVLLLNWVSVAMCIVGGYLFANDYARYRSLRLACLEHALYGCLVFTLGLGRFFYTGAAWH